MILLCFIKVFTNILRIVTRFICHSRVIHHQASIKIMSESLINQNI